MQRTAYDCDRCKAKDEKCKEFRLEVGDSFDGIERTTDYEYVHLCMKCLSDASDFLMMKWLNSTTSYDSAKIFIKWAINKGK